MLHLQAGGARRNRTADLVIANDALSQLSYSPFYPASWEMAVYGFPLISVNQSSAAIG